MQLATALGYQMADLFLAVLEYELYHSQGIEHITNLILERRRRYNYLEIGTLEKSFFIITEKYEHVHKTIRTITENTRKNKDLSFKTVQNTAVIIPSFQLCRISVIQLPPTGCSE